jgi:2-oxoglutarate dehydrogenase complex dehydrogenase (E1) component-like enzyme
MPHRGRLNVLANLAGKSYGQIFREFEGNQDPRSVQGSGDVKYHLGPRARSPRRTAVRARSTWREPVAPRGGQPGARGITRAKQDRIDKGEGGFTVLPILMHGDAAFAGRASCRDAQPLAAARLPHRRHHPRHHQQPGGLHDLAGRVALVRSTAPTSRGMIQAPIFHVNGDDPRPASGWRSSPFEYRQAFKKDVVIDMVCYRRRGHNEATTLDDPAADVPPDRGKRSVRHASHRGR